MIKKENFLIFSIIGFTVLYYIITFIVFLTNARFATLVKKKISIGAVLVSLIAILGGSGLAVSAETIEVNTETTISSSETINPSNSQTTITVPTITPNATGTMVMCYTMPPSVSPSVTPTVSPQIVMCYTMPPTSHPPVSPTNTINTDEVVYDIKNDWGNGAIIGIAIKNNSTSPIKKWELSFDFTNGQKITSLWGGSYTQEGTSVTITSNDWNSEIPAGNSINIGLVIAYTSENDIPQNIVLTTN